MVKNFDEVKAELFTALNRQEELQQKLSEAEGFVSVIVLVVDKFFPRLFHGNSCESWSVIDLAKSELVSP
jgi:hypothetical protein